MADKRDFFRSICKVSRAFGTTRRKEELLSLIVESAVETMAGKAACLFLADEDRDVFVPVSQKGLSENYLHANPLHAREIVSALVESGHLEFKDAVNDPRLEHHEAKKTEGIASLLVVPVIVKDKIIGVLTLYTADRRKFTKDEVELLKALAEQGGMAIENARLLDRIRRNSSLFLDLASSINSSLDIAKILHIMTADICEALGMKGASIRLLNKDKGTLDLITTYGLSEAFLAKGPVSAEKSIAAALKGETVAITDVAADSRIQYPKETLAEGVASMLCVPIRAKEEIIGVMRLFSAVRREFPEDMIMLINALAHTGGLAIQNASLYLQIENDMKDLKEEMWGHKSWF